MIRPPSEIMDILNQAQDRLGEDFDLFDLLWDIFDDVLDKIDELENSDNKLDSLSIYDLTSAYLSENYG